MNFFNTQGMFALIISVFLNGAVLASAYADEDVSAKIDTLLVDTYQSTGPGAAVLVVKDGKTILRKAYGMGNIEHNIALRPDMVFRIGSISKQFTSTAIMRLVEEEKINLEDSITKFLPDYPTHGHNITVENLLTHTSGIKSYTSLPETMKQISNEDLTVEELTESFQNEPMDFAPSTEFLYNNSGYSLLGAIIEKVSGKSYEKYLQDEFFTPLNMSKSYYGSFTKIIPDRAMGYQIEEDKVSNATYLSMRVPYAAGALLSTVDDLKKWNDALFAGKVVSKKSLKRMTTPYVLSNGKNAGSDKAGQGYGYALQMADMNGHLVVGHSGGINGFITRMQNIQSEDLIVIVLTNSTGGKVNPVILANQISAIVLGETYTPPEK